MIRNFQRRPEEAIELCRSGFAYLNENLDANEHRLHRSILLYNIAQVYAATGAHEEALEYYAGTIEMDPNYSEYYNDRANVLLQMDRLEEAKADYLQAIELSPPYFEVFTNLGQCYRRMGEMEDAIRRQVGISQFGQTAWGNATGRLGEGFSGRGDSIQAQRYSRIDSSGPA